MYKLLQRNYINQLNKTILCFLLSVDKYDISLPYLNTNYFLAWGYEDIPIFVVY